MVFVSCGDGDNPEDNGVDGIDQRPFVTLHISPVTRSASLSETKVVEKIKTLRIIMLSDSYIEVNRLIDFTDYDSSGEGENVDLFSYMFVHPTVPGKKKFYLIANEGEVEGLSETLNRYEEETVPEEGNNSASGNGNTFETVMSTFSFTPEYKINDGVVHLPYTAIYEGSDLVIGEEISAGGINFIDKKMYLVPVANKFTIKFENFRRFDAEISGMSLWKADSDNYLYAILDNREKTKKFNGEDLYWIDWMAAVAEESNITSDNSGFNTAAGYITNFEIPNTSTLTEISFETKENDKIVPHDPDRFKAGVKVYGPYYVPESINTEEVPTDPEDDSVTNTIPDSSHKYYLKLSLRNNDEKLDKPGEPYDVSLRLNNVKSLFRGNHVVINVKMTEDQLEIYAEIAPWVVSSFQGYAQETDDDEEDE